MSKTRTVSIIKGDGKPIIAKTFGRNDLCACKSGKKVKKCCGSDTVYYHTRSSETEKLESTIDKTKIENVIVRDVNRDDYPDLVDAYISYAEYNGEPLSSLELDTLNEDKNYVHEQALLFLQ